jgi:hypothetical protein
VLEKTRKHAFMDELARVGKQLDDFNLILRGSPDRMKVTTSPPSPPVVDIPMLFNLLLQDPRQEWKAFWKSQLSANPIVTKVALLILSTSAEATPSERTFSVAGTISKRRGGGRLKPGTLSNLTMLQRITRNNFEGKIRSTRAKRLKTVATQPLATASLAAVVAAVALPSATAVDDLSEEFEARLQADVEQVEAMIDAGELAFITGEDGDLELQLLEQNIELLTSADLVNFDDGDDEYSLDNLLSAFSGAQQPGSLMSAVEASEVP